jgi:hypothetical protein
MRSPTSFTLALSLLGSACTGVEPDPEQPTGSGLFVEGCPVAGQATARVIADPAARLRGEVAVGGPGDLVLMNEHAAFVITQPGSESTYWYYGGALADAAALRGCEQLTDDLIDDVGLVLADVEITGFADSRVRAFEGLQAEVVNDGSDGGDAIVRVHGVDATHWLVEHTLQQDAVESGGRAFDVPYGVEITVDYVLAPDLPVLEVRVHVVGDERAPEALAGAVLQRFADRLEVAGLETQRVAALGLNLAAGMPWVTASDGAGAVAFAVDGYNLGRMNISGVEIALDLDHAFSDPVTPQGTSFVEGDTYGVFFAVGATGPNSATRHLRAVHPDPLRLGPYELHPVRGTVVDGLTGQAVAGAQVAVEVSLAEGGWGTLDAVYADAQGKFEVEVAAIDPSWSYRLVARDEGRETAGPVVISPGDERAVALELPPAGVLAYELTDLGGEPIAARLDLVRSDGLPVRLHLFDEGEVALEPGSYTWTASRGWEWAPATGEVVVPAGGVGTIDVVLEHVLDTTGFLSVDSHIHSSPSADSRVPMERQLVIGASHGLDVAMSTDHEVIVGFELALQRSGLEGHIGIVSGLEMTSSALEHMTAFPLEPDGTPQGGLVRWYGLDFEETVQAQRDRGAEIVLINHPSYLDLIGWDPLTGLASLDPTLLGLEQDAVLWSWTLDGLEVMNGTASPFSSGNGRFDLWQAMLNLGHRATAVASSDDHGGRETGYPRSYFVSSTDDPGAFVEAELVEAFRDGRTFMSAGAFLRVSANGAGLGELATASEGQVDVAVRVDALPGIEVDEVVIYANCDEVARIPADDPAGLIKLETEVRLLLDVDAHLAVAAFGASPMPVGLPPVGPDTPRAMSNAIYVDIGGDGVFSAPGGKNCTYGP